MLNQLRVLLVLVVAMAGAARAQQPIGGLPDFDKKEQWFDHIAGREPTTLINGPEYFIAFQGGPTHPFFGALSLAEGQLWYDNQFYPQVQLMYDTYTDMLVIRHRDKRGMFSMINLDQKKVQGFILSDHHFEKVDNTKALSGHADNGYYDILFKGKHLSLVAKRIKSENKAAANVEYKSDDRYFFIYDGKWSPMRGVKDFVMLSEKRGQDILQFVKPSRAKLRKLNEEAMKAAASYCDGVLTMEHAR
jgi:hypothetical protein